MEDTFSVKYHEGDVNRVFFRDSVGPLWSCIFFCLKVWQNLCVWIKFCSFVTVDEEY